MLTTPTENAEIVGIINRLLDNLLGLASSQVGLASADLRRQVGDLRANYSDYLADGSFNIRLLSCFTTARIGNAKLSNFVIVRDALFLETPVGVTSAAIVQAAIAFCLSAESRIITAIVFTSRDDVETMIATMKAAFDTARDLAADQLDSQAYQNLSSLAGALTNHLASVARPLPRMVTFNLPSSLPALVLSNRIYYSAERWEEVVDENHIVNPAFCPRIIRGLSA